MKKQSLFLLIALLYLTFAAFKADKKIKAVVIRDCTGTYLQMDGKDYQVCNEGKVASFTDGSKVKIKFKKIEACEAANKEKIACMMYHASEGWIEVLKIKK